MHLFIEYCLKKFFQSRIPFISYWKRNALYHQRNILKRNISLAQNTHYGKKYKFSNIKNITDFQNQVPVVIYEDIAPFINEMLQGKENILWKGKIPYFSKSSGTTNDISKYIPVSHSSLHDNNYKAGKDVYSFFFKRYPKSKLFHNYGAVFSLGGSYVTNELGIKIGDVSALLLSELPSWAERYREPSPDIALMSKWKEKLPAMITNTVDKNITHILGVPTWFISMFEKMKETHSYVTLRDIWPNLELFIHGAVAFGPYRALFQELLPFKDMKYLEVYNASEGFFAIQDTDHQGEMILLTHHGIFYEFIPMKTHGTKEALAVDLSKVEIGIDYALIITTNAGLWRYDIGDTICFTSLNPYRIKITGRTKHHINVFGEELMVGNADTALLEVCEKTGVIIEHYSVGPIFMNQQGKGAHEWVIEFRRPPKDNKEFALLLDKQLCNLNSDYAAKRQDNIALQPLVLKVAPKGTFLKWMEQRNKLGGQYKVPKLSQERKYIEELIALF